MPTKKSTTKKAKATKTPSQLIEQVKAGMTDLSDLLIDGFTYDQIVLLVQAGEFEWEEEGASLRMPAPKTKTKLTVVEKPKPVEKAIQKTKPKTDDDEAIPEIPHWLALRAQTAEQRAKLQSLWENNPGFRKRAFNTRAEESQLNSTGKLDRWVPENQHKTIFDSAMRFLPLGSPSVQESRKRLCQHPEMLAHGKQGNSIGFCERCDGLVTFAVDGSPAEVILAKSAGSASQKA